jgi:spore germination protein GerM
MKNLILLIGVVALLATACGAGEVGSAGPVTPGSNSNETTTTTASTTTTTAPNDGTTAPTTQPPTDTTEPIEQVFVELFFVKEGLSAKSIVRAVDTPLIATNAVRALIDGPTPTEQDTELSTAIPSDTLLLGLVIEEGLATIDLSREFEVGGGSFNILSRLAQVVYTLTQFPTVDEVLFHIDGKPVEVFSGEGVVLEDPVDRSDYATILPIEPLVDPTASAPWGQNDLPDVLLRSDIDPTDLGRVALVASGDVLNVRQDPGVAAPIVGMLLPGVVVLRTGLEEIVGSSLWVQIETPLGGFWVNDRFLAAWVPPFDFENDPRIDSLLAEFGEIIATDGDLREVVSPRGLYVSHHAAPIRFAYDELDTILTDPTTYKWPSNALGPDELDEIPGRTFAEAVADSFLSAYDDLDTMTTVNEPILGGNGRPAEYAIPFEFESFNYIGVFDPMDNPDFGGLDWTTWYVSIDYEDGAPVIVGMTVDMWAP